MKKWGLPLLVLALIITYWLKDWSAHQGLRQPAAAPGLKQSSEVKTVLEIMKPRDPASVAKKSISQNRRPSQKIQMKSGPALAPQNYQPRLLSDIQIGGNYSVLEDLRVIPKSQWKPEMGEFVQSSSHFIYFRPHSETDSAYPVALDNTSGIFYPVSHILHVKEVSAEIRQELIQETLEEYYFNERLKLLSLTSSPSSVLRHYKELTSKGYEVRLEVLKGLPQAK